MTPAEKSLGRLLDLITADGQVAVEFEGAARNAGVSVARLRTETAKAVAIVGAARARDTRDRCHPTDGGRQTVVAWLDGYVVVRRPGCMPVVETEATWLSRPLWTPPA